MPVCARLAAGNNSGKILEDPAEHSAAETIFTEGGLLGHELLLSSVMQGYLPFQRIYFEPPAVKRIVRPILSRGLRR